MSLQILDKVVYVARSNIGYGETEANNRGRFIDLIGGDKLTVEDPAWCALFAGYCYRRAYELLEMSPPPWLYRRPGVPEAGAWNLVMALGREGCRFRDPRLVRPGDLGLVKRSGGHHVFVVEKPWAGELHTIAGNEGRFPSKVKRTVRFKDGEPEPGFVIFASMVDA